MKKYALVLLAVAALSFKLKDNVDGTFDNLTVNNTATVTTAINLPHDVSIQAGNGDNASWSTNNFYLSGWYGMGMKSYDGTTMGYYNFRTGVWDVKGGFQISITPPGYNVKAGIYAGEGDNASYTANNMNISSWNGIGFKNLFNGGNFIYFNTRTGDINTKGTLAAAGLTTTGNVGIGTATPTNAALAVKGLIHTQEVNVDMNGWSDYVFKPTYNLRSLAEVKTYIDENHHLPDVPSEKEILHNGQNLGEMNKVLLQKVEELTLYLLEKDKELKRQKEVSNTQEQQLAELKTLFKSEIKALKKQVGSLKGKL